MRSLRSWFGLVIIAVTLLFLAPTEARAALHYNPPPSGQLTYGYLFWNGRTPVQIHGAGRVRTRNDVVIVPTTGKFRPAQFFPAGTVITILRPCVAYANGGYIMFAPAK